MIAKHVPMRSLGKSDFAGLAEYITDAQSKTERLGLVTVTNCQAGTVQAATTSMDCCRSKPKCWRRST